MKRLLILDAGSNCLDMAIRARASGWSVKWWDKPSKDGTIQRAGEGIVDKIDNFNDIQRKWLDWADLIYMPDNILYTDFLEPYRLKGYPILAASPEAAKLELDRAEGQKAMSCVGIPIMESKEFHDYDSAISHCIKHPEFLVSKPSGDANKSLSYVAHDVDDLIYMLSRWKSRPDMVQAAKKEGFILQERKYGIEMAVGGFFGPHGFGDWFYENWEYKKLMDGDLGVNTGEMGTLSRMVKRSKLAQKILLPLAPKLHELGYVGYVDNNAIIDEFGDPWPMELTMRDGWPTKHNITAHVKNPDSTQWMLDMINGVDSMQCIDGEVCVSVLIALPDFPYSRISNKELCGIPVRGGNDLEHYHLSEVMMGMVPSVSDGKVIETTALVTSGDYVMVVTGVGSTISEARRDCYNAVNKVKIPNSPFYRTDIGAGRMKKQLPLLHKHGYGRGLEF